MSLFARQLARCGHNVILSDREEKIINGKVAEVFTPLPDRVGHTDPGTNDRALVKTLRGVVVFDSTNTETAATHRLCLYWRDDVGAEQWVELKGKRLRILTAQNCCEQDERLILMCTERGPDSAVNRA